jgi:hypothetical protein
VLVAVVLLLAGLAAIGTGSAITRRRLVEHFGSAEPEVLDQAEGTGVVPFWVSAMVLGGWVLALAGIALVAYELVG